MSVETLAVQVDELMSRASISELVARYCFGIDRNDPEVFRSIWHDDALLHAAASDFHGIDAIMRFLELSSRVWQEAYHWTTNHVVTFSSADEASGISELFSMCWDHDGLVSFISARYVDVYSRRNGVWKFDTREVRRWFASPGQDIPPGMARRVVEQIAAAEP